MASFFSFKDATGFVIGKNTIITNKHVSKDYDPAIELLPIQTVTEIVVCLIQKHF